MENDVPKTLRCIEGEEWPTESFTCIVTAAGPLTEKSVVFCCPGDHSFTLEQALEEGIFTPEQGQRIMAGAKKRKEEHERNSGLRSSDIIPDEKITSLKLACARCGASAQWGPGGMLEKTERSRWPEFVLCSDCAASWHNEDHGDSLELLDRTSGKPYVFFWTAIFKRFCQKKPPFTLAEAKQALQECREQAKALSSKRHSGARPNQL